MDKRVTLKCCNLNCGRTYTLFKHLNVAEAPELIVRCPFCETEGVVDLAPWRSPVTELLKSGEVVQTGWELILPDILPTTKREE